MKSIRRQLTRALLVVLVLLLGGGLTGIYFLVRAEMIEAFDDTLRAKAEAISTLMMVDDGQLTVNFSDKFMRGFDDDDPKEFFEIWNEHGVSVQTSESLGSRHLPNRAGDFKRPEVWSLELPPKQEAGRALGVEFVPRGTSKLSTRANTTRYRLVVAARTRDLDEELAEILLIVGVGGVALIGLTVLVVPLVLRRGLRPLERLADDVEKVNADTLMLRLPADDVPRELQVITARLNALFARLEAAFERERRVSGAMAHELRTPIAELRNLAECALKWPEARDLETDRDALAIARQMEAMVTHMLALARSETGHLRPNLEPVNLALAVEQAWKPVAETAARRNNRLHTTLQPVTVQADPALVRAILGNLLENSAEYSPEGSEIRVSLKADAAGFVLEVANPAPDLTPGDVSRFFERFWRKEAARSGGRHAGLGLSLAKAFARCLGWEVTSRLDADSLLTLAITGPAGRP